MKRIVLFIVILAGFATLALGDNTPLPKKPKAQPSLFVSFKAEPLGDSVQLSFTTYNETKVRRFAVMANDGNEWHEVGSLQPVNCGIGLTYSFMYKGGDHKFQIAAVDSNGAVHLSHEETLGAYTESGIFIFPNPAANFVLVRASGVGEVRVYNFDGQLMFRNIYGSSPYGVDLSRLPHGAYAILVYQHGIVVASKVIVKED